MKERVEADASTTPNRTRSAALFGSEGGSRNRKCACVRAALFGERRNELARYQGNEDRADADSQGELFKVTEGPVLHAGMVRRFQCQHQVDEPTDYQERGGEPERPAHPTGRLFTHSGERRHEEI